MPNLIKDIKRFFKPSIEDAGLVPYRIDEDLSVRIPIETIEKEILDSKICFAEISTDNPNVWYELGFATACGKDVVLVCSEERDKFPFDIQHRQIIRYKTESKGDFEILHQKITEKIKAYIDNPTIQKSKNILENQTIKIDQGDPSGYDRLVEIEEKKLLLSVKPKIKYNGSTRSGYSDLDIDLINNGETAYWQEINLLSGELQLHSLSIPWEMGKGKTRKIFARSTGQKHINDINYEIELKYSDELENKYRLILTGRGGNVKITSDELIR